MTRAELEHAIRAVCDVARTTDVIVIGSQAILGTHPDAPPRLRQSMEVDMVFPGRPDLADRVEGALGEDSMFHHTHAFYVQGLTLEAPGPILPPGWEERLVAVQNANTRQCTGRCLEPHDLAASKLAAFRPKDLDYVRVMLAEHLITGATLLERVASLSTNEERRERLRRWIEATVKSLPSAVRADDA